ncbi:MULTISPECIES: hypothetical protein [Pseudomonas]|uniref:hypothetical protein n=1 Tax=Pseudomonas TaxID=286 RepID=UPI00147438E7|nr:MULTISPECIES: hypothetical protein [Pseudomonas]NNA20466.1 hypothetical protein [Pseudomonas lundensis]
MITDENKVELISALSEVVLEHLLLKAAPRTVREYRERNHLAGALIGRLMAAVVHEGDLGARYLDLAKECELKGLAMTSNSQSAAQKAVLRLIKGGA